MKRLFSNVINLTLVLIVGVALSGCTVSNASIGSSSPWSLVDLDTAVSYTHLTLPTKA